MPRRGLSEASALLETAFDILNVKSFLQQLDELAECCWKPFSLEIYAHSNMVYLCMAGDDSILDFLVIGIYTWMGDCEIHDVEDYTLNISNKAVVVGSDFKLSRPDIYPMNDYTSMKTDSLVPVVTALSQVNESDKMLIQIMVRPIRDTPWLHLKLALSRAEENFKAPFRARRWLRKNLGAPTQKLVLDKCARRLFWINYRITAIHEPTSSTTDSRAQTLARLSQSVHLVANAARIYNTVDENRFVLRRLESGKSWLHKVQARLFYKPFRVTSSELATFWHPPALQHVPITAQVISKKAAPPCHLPTQIEDPNVCNFAHTNFRNQETIFGIKRFDRRRHMYVVGKSGSGKSCLLQLLVRNDIENGFGCAVLDPHGDLIDDILRLVPQHRIKDVVLFDPSDPKYAPSFNPMDPIRPELRLRVTLSFLDTFKRAFGADWSERMDHVLRYAMLGLLSAPGSNILSLRRMLSDEAFRTDIVRRATDESVKRFWLRDFAARREDFEEGPISRLLNRIDELLATETMRNVLGQSANLFNFREFMDSRKIVLLKISKGVLGSENANMLGSMLIWKIYEAAMSRADIPASDRQDFFFYVDEFQNFATESFSEILSESRKYNLCLTFANQFLGQLPASVRRTVFGNISNLITFRVGADDADIVAKELQPQFGSEDIINLPLRDFYTRLSVDGEIQEAFSGRTIDLQYPDAEHNYSDECIVQSRKKYCVPIEDARRQTAPNGAVANNKRGNAP